MTAYTKYNNHCRKPEFRAHARVHALQKGQEGRIGVVLAKLKVSLVAKSVHVVRQQSLAKK